MNHSSIITRLYSHFAQYRLLWEQQWVNTEEWGAFVFLPEKEFDWEWWSILEIREYIQQGGLKGVELLDGLGDFNFGEEFLVLVIEYVDGPEKQKVHFHKMSSARMN